MRYMFWSYYFLAFSYERWQASRGERRNDQLAFLSSRPMGASSKRMLKDCSVSVPSRLRIHHTSPSSPWAAKSSPKLATGYSASPCHLPSQSTPGQLWYLSALIPVTFEHRYAPPSKNKVRACEAALRYTHFSSRTLEKIRRSFGVLNLKGEGGFVVFWVLWGLTI